MNSITQDIIFKQSVVEYFLKPGVTVAAKRYKQHRTTIYRWREKYDGTRKSLVNKSRRPHSHPNQHTAKEIAMIKKFKYKIECVQTDNGFEFTNRLNSQNNN